MGCVASAMGGPRLEALLVAAVMSAKRHSAGQLGKKTFNSLLLQAGSMRQGFQTIQQLFRLLGHGQPVVALQVLEDRAQPDLKLDASNAVLHEVLAALRADGKSSIDAGDFAVVWMVLHLKDPASVQFEDIQVTLKIVEDSFNCFDYSADGALEKKELSAALASEPCKAAKKREQRGVADVLFEVLDLDHSGTVSFKEFLLGMVSIVVDEEEEQGADKPQQ